MTDYNARQVFSATVAYANDVSAENLAEFIFLGKCGLSI